MWQRLFNLPLSTFSWIRTVSSVRIFAYRWSTYEFQFLNRISFFLKKFETSLKMKFCNFFQLRELLSVIRFIFMDLDFKWLIWDRLSNMKMAKLRLQMLHICQWLRIPCRFQVADLYAFDLEHAIQDFGSCIATTSIICMPVWQHLSYTIAQLYKDTQEPFLGMTVTIKVGNRSQIPSPPDDFPKCGNYLMPIFADWSNKRKLNLWVYCSSLCAMYTDK